MMTANSSTGPEHSEISDAVEACFGANAVSYVSNKARGGANGKKGSAYEEHFTTAKVVALLSAQLQRFDADWPILEEQAYGFVDDLVVRKSAGTHYHQLKNTQALSWHSGENSLATDFKRQVDLCFYLKSAPATTTLVVSSQAVCQTMQDTCPARSHPTQRLSISHILAPA